jgi:hypothetical protein
MPIAENQEPAHIQYRNLGSHLANNIGIFSLINEKNKISLKRRVSQGRTEEWVKDTALKHNTHTRKRVTQPSLHCKPAKDDLVSNAMGKLFRNLEEEVLNESNNLGKRDNEMKFSRSTLVTKDSECSTGSREGQQKSGLGSSVRKRINN